MNEFLEMIARVKQVDADPRIGRASRALVHILLDDMTEMMRTRILLIATNLLMEDGYGSSFDFSRPL